MRAEEKKITVNAVAGQTESADAGQVSRNGWEWVVNGMLGDQSNALGHEIANECIYINIKSNKLSEMIQQPVYLQITLWIACTHAAELECKLQNQTSVMDHLTSFDGSVSWGHVRLLIFHNSPVKTHAHHIHLSFSFTENTQTKHISDTFQTPPRAIWLRG